MIWITACVLSATTLVWLRARLRRVLSIGAECCLLLIISSLF